MSVENPINTSDSEEELDYEDDVDAIAETVEINTGNSQMDKPPSTSAIQPHEFDLEHFKTLPDTQADVLQYTLNLYKKDIKKKNDVGSLDSYKNQPTVQLEVEQYLLNLYKKAIKRKDDTANSSTEETTPKRQKLSKKMAKAKSTPDKRKLPSKSFSSMTQYTPALKLAENGKHYIKMA